MPTPILLPPHSGRKPITLTPDQEQRLLSRRVEADHTDPFASDTQEAIRRLGRLALRRDERQAADYLALGDLCAQYAIQGDQLKILYVGKALSAYQEAGRLAVRPEDATLAKQMIADLVNWTVRVAEQAPSQRNIAVAIWADGDANYAQSDPAMMQRLLRLYQQSIITDGASTMIDEAERTVEVSPMMQQSDHLAADVTLNATDDSDILLVSVNQTPDYYDDATLDDARYAPAHEYQSVVNADPLENVPIPAEAEDVLSSQDDFLDMVIEYGLPEAELPASSPQPTNSPAEDMLPHLSSPQPSIKTGTEPIALPGDFKQGDWIIDTDPLIRDKRYKVLRTFKGGMGIVYICYDERQRSLVAIKTYQASRLADGQTVNRFEREAHVWISFDKHPNIVKASKVQSFGTGPDGLAHRRPHIILEYIAPAEGVRSDLNSWIKSGQLDLETALRFAIDICRGMAFAVAHHPSLVHRDLKPANILISQDGIAKVTDFGLASTVSAVEESLASVAEVEPENNASVRLTKAGAILGTLPYMSPEQCQGRATTIQSDIYALGAVLYEMLTGRHIFEVDTNRSSDWLLAHINQTPNFPITLPMHIPDAIKSVILRCLAKEPERRPPSWEVLLEELARHYERLVGQPPPSPTIQDMALYDLMDQAYGLTEINAYQEALTAYDRALQLPSATEDISWVLARRARLLRIMKRYQEALVGLDKALELRPQYGWAWLQRGRVLEHLGDSAAARHSYAQAIEYASRRDSTYARLNLAKLHLEQLDYAAALELLTQALNIAPEIPEVHTRQALILQRLGRDEDALTVLDNAVLRFPTWGIAWYSKGKALYNVGRFEEAELAFRRATTYHPDSGIAWRWLAAVQFERGAYADAWLNIQQAVHINPTDQLAWLQHGHILHALQRYDEALASFERVLSRRRKDVRALRGKAAALTALQRIEEAAIYQDLVSGITESNGAESAAPSTVESQPLSYAQTDNESDTLVSQLRTMNMAKQYAEMLDLLNTRAKAGHTISAAALAQWGYALRQQGHLELAVRKYADALALRPDMEWVWADKGQLHLWLEEFDEAEAAYARAIALMTAEGNSYERAHAIRGQADALIRSGHADAAVRLLTQAIEEYPTYSRLHIKLIQAHRRLRQDQQALAIAQQALETFPKEVRLWNELGITANQLRQLPLALEAFEQAVQLEPHQAQHWYNKANTLLSLRRDQDALTALNRAIEYEPQHVDSWLKRAETLRRLGRFREALAAIDQALTIQPNHAWAYNVQGQILVQVERHTEAIQAFERALSSQPTQPWFAFNMVEPLLKLGRREEALEVLDNLLHTSPQPSKVWRERGRILRLLERHEEAVKLYAEALQHHPNDVWLWHDKGRAHEVLGQHELALQQYRHAAELSPQATFWSRAGDMLVALDQVMEAEQAYQQALQLDPHNSFAQHGLRIVREKLSLDKDNLTP